ncbi:MAG: divergent polysaccharide deacetylase family protein [Desulfobacterales bacterium]|nr:divergent polysaccharide deacetylase family protein [Desulfobacterales bacterium]
MSTRRKKKPAPRKRRRTTRRKSSSRFTLIKIVAAFALLIGIVGGAGALLWHYAPPPTPAPRVKEPAVPVAKAKPSPAARSRTEPAKPVYEVFPPKKIARRTPKPAPLPRPIKGLPRVAIIIDDIGYDRQLLRQFLDLDIPLTFSVLPQSPFIQSAVREIRTRNHEIMLHQPMEPVEYPQVNPGPGALLATMSPDELIAQLNRNLDALPGVKGINNHMGSRLTAESTRMYQVFSVLKERQLYFVDSRSTVATVCRPSARMFQVPFAERDIFLDHFQEAGFVRKQFKELLREADRHGQAVAIGHPYPVTIEIFREVLPTLKKRVRLVPASVLVRIDS